MSQQFVGDYHPNCTNQSGGNSQINYANGQLFFLNGSADTVTMGSTGSVTITAGADMHQGNLYANYNGVTTSGYVSGSENLRIENNRLANENEALLKKNKALETAIAQYEDDIKVLQQRSNNQQHNCEVLTTMCKAVEEEHAELKKAHEELREVIGEIDETPERVSTISNYEKQVETLTFELIHAETELDIAKSELAQLKKRVADAEQNAAECIAVAGFWKNKAERFENLSLEEKVKELDRGVKVWQTSTGKGPFQTICETGIKHEDGRVFGMKCRDSKGRDVKIEVSDLTTLAPEKQPVKLSKLNVAVILFFVAAMITLLCTIPMSPLMAIGTMLFTSLTSGYALAVELDKTGRK